MQEVCCPYGISLSSITPVADHSQILFSLPVSRLHFLVGRFALILLQLSSFQVLLSMQGISSCRRPTFSPLAMPLCSHSTENAVQTVAVVRSCHHSASVYRSSLLLHHLEVHGYEIAPARAPKQYV